jgi:hypothetical protein
LIGFLENIESFVDEIENTLILFRDKNETQIIMPLYELNFETILASNPRISAEELVTVYEFFELIEITPKIRQTFDELLSSRNQTNCLKLILEVINVYKVWNSEHLTVPKLKEPIKMTDQMKEKSKRFLFVYKIIEDFFSIIIFEE